MRAFRRMTHPGSCTYFQSPKPHITHLRPATFPPSFALLVLTFPCPLQSITFPYFPSPSSTNNFSLLSLTLFNQQLSLYSVSTTTLSFTAHTFYTLSTMGLIDKTRFDSIPKVTFYLTAVFELRGETDQYTYSIE